MTERKLNSWARPHIWPSSCVIVRRNDRNPDPFYTLSSSSVQFWAGFRAMSASMIVPPLKRRNATAQGYQDPPKSLRTADS